MEIKGEYTEPIPDPNGGPQTMHLRRIVIEIDPGDDPRGILSGLVAKDRLEAFLRLCGNPEAPRNQDDGYALLRDFGFVANMVDSRYGELMWACRDTLGMSWREIAAPCEVAPTSVRRRVAAVRKDYRDEHNVWRDADGLHQGTADEARQHVAEATHQENAEVEGTAHVARGKRINVVGIVNNYPED